MKTDIHQHLWTEPLVQALAQRTEFPFVRDEHGLTVLFLAGERPYVIDLASEAPSRRAALVRRDGLDRALLCLSSPLGIESLPARAGAAACSTPTTRARSRSASPSACGARSRSTAPTRTTSTARLTAAASASRCPPARSPVSIGSRACSRCSRAFPRSARHCSSTPEQPPRPETGASSLGDPLWWPALTHYVADMHAAWLAFARRRPRRAPRAAGALRDARRPRAAARERLAARGGPDRSEPDPLVFYDTSSYGPLAIGALSDAVGGPGQLLYGSDRPVVEPTLLHEPGALDWELLADASARAFGAPSPGDADSRVPRLARGRLKGPPPSNPPKRPGRAGGGSPMRTPLASVPRPRDRDLTAPELQAFVAELSSQPELWIERVHHDHTQRVYEELLSDAHLTAWLICWMDDHDTGFHDHDVSAGAVAVVGGRVREERLTIDGPTRDRSSGRGRAFTSPPADIHRVRHSGVDPAVTLHVYSPPLSRMGAYVVGEDGVLERHSVAPEEELRPLAASPAVP